VNIPSPSGKKKKKFNYKRLLSELLSFLAQYLTVMVIRRYVFIMSTTQRQVEW